MINYVWLIMWCVLALRELIAEMVVSVAWDKVQLEPEQYLAVEA